MKCVAWNVRGLNQVYKQIEFKEFCRSNKIALIAVIEHYIKQSKARNVITKVVGKWEW